MICKNSENPKGANAFFHRTMTLKIGYNNACEELLPPTPKDLKITVASAICAKL